MVRRPTGASHPNGVNGGPTYSNDTANSRLTCVRSAPMTKLLPVLVLAIPLVGAAVTPAAMATAHADPITFAPDWPNHRNQTESTICAALAQGWTRRQIVSTAEKANDVLVTGMDDDEAAERADAFIDAARYQDCPALNAN